MVLKKICFDLFWQASPDTIMFKRVAARSLLQHQYRHLIATSSVMEAPASYTTGLADAQIAINSFI